MYQVVSQQRPGRPVWALISTAVLLLLSVGFAWAVIHYKSSGESPGLGDLRDCPRGELRCRIPAGWKESLEESLVPGLVLAAQEPPGGNTPARQPRQLFVFRGLPRGSGVASLDAAQAITAALQRLTPRAITLDSRPAMIGPLPGWTLASVAESPLSGERVFCISRAALAPRGQVVGLVLLTHDPIRPADRRLLDELSRHLQLDAAPPVKPETVMDAAGIHFSAEQGVAFLGESIGRVPRVQMCGGEEGRSWFLLAYRVPLGGPRTPETLVRDLAMNTLGVTELPARIEEQTFGQRVGSQVSLTYPGRDQATILISCAEVDDQTGLLLVGRHEPEVADELRRLSNSICESAQVDSYGSFLDVGKAQQTARELLERLAREGLASTWGPYQHRAQEYVIRSAGYAYGRASHGLNMDRTPEGLWWEVAVGVKYTSLGYEASERWRLRDDDAGHRLAAEINGPEGQIQYVETRAPRAGDIRRELVSRGKRRSSSTAIDDLYATDFGLIWAAGRLPRGSDSVAMFTCVDLFTPETARCTLLALGEMPLPGNGSQRRAAAVQVQRDYDPAPQYLYFDENGTLLAILGDNGVWRILTRNSAHGDEDG